MTEEIQQQLHESFYSACPDAILILKEGVISTCNAAALTFFQTTEKNLIGKKLIHFIPENIQEDIQNKLNDDLNLNHQVSFEGVIQNTKGDNIDVRIFLINIQTGKQIFTQVLIRDITLQKEGERNNEILVKKLEEEHRKLLAITDVLDKSAIVSITDKEGTITKVNEEFCQISKYSREELLGANHNIVNSGFHGKEFWQSMWRDISRGKTWRAEVKNKAKDGSFYWVDTVINAVLDNEGKITGYLSIRYLITDKKEKELEMSARNEQLAIKEDELKQNEKHLYQFLDNIPVGINVFSKTGDMIFVNEIAKKLLGYDIVEQAAANNQNEASIQAKLAGTNEDYPQDRFPHVLALRGQVAQVDDLEIIRDSKHTLLQVNGTPIYSENGEIEFAIAIFQDITQRKAQELEIKTKNEELAATEEELKQNLEELETQRDYIQGINEEIKAKSTIVEKNSQILLELNKNEAIHTGNLDLAFENITKLVAENLSIERVSIWRYDGQNIKISSLKQYQKTEKGYDFVPNEDISKEEAPIYFKDLISEQNIVADFAKNHPALVEFVEDYFIPLQINSLLDMPYFIDGKLAGIICCETQNQYKNWTLEDIAFIKGITDSITIAVKTKQQIEEQEKVRKSEKLLFQFLDKIPVGITIIGSDKMMFYSNEISRKIFPYGLNPKEGPETANYKLNIAGTDTPYPKEKFPSSSVFKGIASSRDDMEIVQDGKRMPIEISASPVYSETGEILYAIAAVQDISERRAKELEIKKKNDELTATEKELRQNFEELKTIQETLLETQLEQEKFVSIIKNVDAFVAITDMQGKTEFLNERGKIISGFGEDYKGKSIAEFHDEKGAKIAQEIIIPAVMQKGFWKGEHQLQNYATKELFQTIANIFVIQDPNTKQPIALATVQLDITAQKDLEKSIKEQNERLQATQDALLETQLEQEKFVSIIKNVDALVAITDMQGNTKFLNEKGKLLSGFGENYKGRNISEFHNEEGAKIAQEIIIPAVMQKGFWKGEHQLQNYLTKEVFDTLGNVFVIQDPNTKQPIALATVQLDITAQKDLEKSIQEQNERLQASEEELSQNMEELLATQEAMASKQILIEEARLSVEKQNSKLEANEAVLKKAFTKMKEQDLKLRENVDALQTQEEELRQNMEELQTTQEVMAYQKDILEISNRQITKSISYAQTIQNAFLPPKKLIKRLLPESFVIYKPKDIVSGDFYWISEHKDKILIGAIDCTGHGVPGAFMSLVASNVLNEIIIQREILQPNIILQELHKGVVKKLNQKEGANNDGMDLSLCLIEKTPDNQTKLTFGGVKQNLYIVRNQELIELKSNRHSIGGGKRDEERSYEQEEIMLQKNDSVFLPTDGYADQADQERKSFSKKKFRELLLEIGHLSAQEQKKALENSLAEHQKQTDQRDDITVFGFKV